MEEKNSEVQLLKKQIERLEHENAYLKDILAKSGIPYSIPAAIDEKDAEVLNTNYAGQIIPEEITLNHARQFFSYFWGRMDVYSKRSQNKTTSRAGYYPQCDNFWQRGICPKTFGVKIKCKDCNNRSWTALDGTVIENHLKGLKDDASDVIGVYPLFPDGTCRFLVFDFDNHDKGADAYDYANTDESWTNEVNALREICKINSRH